MHHGRPGNILPIDICQINFVCAGQGLDDAPGIEPDRERLAASIPICMHEAIALGKIQPGYLVHPVAFGTGLTWGSVFLRY